MISIIVPVYNIEKYLQQCVESLIVQTYSDIEIILVNDGSVDRSAEICDFYGEKDSRIRVIHKENGGLVSARKAGIKAAKGQYLTYVDGDDWIEPNMCEYMYHKIMNENVDIVICGYYEDMGNVSKQVFHGVAEGRYGKEEMLHLIYPQMIAREPFFDCTILPMTWGKLFRRECVERFILAVDERITMGEDAVCICPCLLSAENIYIMEKCLYHYRQNVFSMVKNVPKIEIERERFRVLYQTGYESLTQYAYIYNMRKQWDFFVMSLMLPRADGLYEGFEDLDYLFPFPQVKKGSRIVLYGAGTYGQRLYRYLEATGFCQVAAWVDRNYAQYRLMDLPVESPEVLPEREYDAIVIAIVFGKPRRSLYQELVQRYPKGKVCVPDEELLFSQETKRAFRLTET